jgi:hypothetical protein
VLGAFTLVSGGCGRADIEGGRAQGKRSSEKGKATQVAEAQKTHDHGGWWCDEHGVPEEECSMCSAKVAAAFKKKGDWCAKHERADSQCFICHPELEAKYAARYEAKYGKKPPFPEDNTAQKEEPRKEEKN